MAYIGIEVPHLMEDQEIEVDVRINGIKRQYQYRLEIFYWEDCKVSSSDRVECIREVVNTYNPDWELVHIGAPTEDYIPVMFRKKRS